MISSTMTMGNLLEFTALGKYYQIYYKAYSLTFLANILYCSSK